MLNGISLGATCRVMSNNDGQAIMIRKVLLELLFPHTRTTSIAASTVSQNQDLLGFGVGRLSLFLPPTGKGRHSKFRCISRRTNVYRPAMAKDIIDAIRNRFPYGILREVMGIHCIWLFFPGSSSVLIIADQFLLLRIYTDDRALGCFKSLFLGLDLLKLRVSVRMSCACLFFLALTRNE